MAKSIAVEIISPERVAAKTSAESVTIPAWEGEMGVLPGHEPYLARLREGEVRLKTAAGTEAIAVSGGFADISRERVRLFVETAELAAQIDLEKARQEAAKAAEIAARKDVDPAQLAAAEGALRWARAQMKTAQRRHHQQGRAPRIDEA